MNIRLIQSWWIASLALAGSTAAASTFDDAPPIAPGPATSVPETVPPRAITMLEAGGFRVGLDTLGFKQVLGHERFRGHYFRIAQFSPGETDTGVPAGAFTFSLLVDDLPKGVTDLKALFTHCIVTRKLIDKLKDGTLQPVRIPRSSGGILFRYPQRLPVPSEVSRGGPGEMTQWHWYFETLQEGKWFEIHFSRGVALNAPVPEGVEEGIVRVVRSLKFPPATPAD